MIEKIQKMMLSNAEDVEILLKAFDFANRLETEIVDNESLSQEEEEHLLDMQQQLLGSVYELIGMFNLEYLLENGDY